MGKSKIYDYSMEKLLTARQAAELLQTHITTVRRWSQSGRPESLEQTMSPDVLAVRAIDVSEVVRGSKRKRIGETLLELGYITETQLNRALEYQRDKGGRLGWIIVTLGYVTGLELYEGLAKHFGLPFTTDTLYIRKSIDRKLAAMITHKEMVQYQVVPFSLRDGILYVLTANPDSQHELEFLKDRFGVNQVSQIVVTDLDLTKISEELYRDRISDISIHGLFYRNPGESAHKVLSKP